MGDAEWMYQNGLTTELGGSTLSGRYAYLDEAPDKFFYEDDTIRFDTALEAQEYAKAHPGIVITRDNQKGGYKTKSKKF